ncbi:MAG: sortase, partial [Chloroflexi bacterium]|nr:sortase [Chloroflexota bacterium]
DEEKKTATDEAVTSATETPGGATPGETQVVVEPTGIGTTPVGSPEPVVSPGAVVMDFPPTPTPYIIPTPGGVRYLMIPKLAAQFSAPIPIVEMPLIDQQWDVSGLGYYVGWLEGTTWMDPAWGNTVLAAHVQLGTNNPGPFWGLGELLPGDEIIVTEGDVERKFVVMSSQKVDPGDWTVTAPTSGPTLTLITCTEWDNSYGVFSQRMVIRAVPAS